MFPNVQERIPLEVAFHHHAKKEDGPVMFAVHLMYVGIHLLVYS